MKIEITKKQIIKALQTEPLKPGNWYHALPEDYLDDVDDVVIKNQKTCPVCAVGAVMRNVLDENQTYGKMGNAISAAGTEKDEVHGGNHFENAKEAKLKSKTLLANYHPLAVLSHLFESLAGQEFRGYLGLPIYRVRKHMISFVKENFPAKIVVDIDGAKPAKNVKVVR